MLLFGVLCCVVVVVICVMSDVSVGLIDMVCVWLNSCCGIVSDVVGRLIMSW